MKKMTILGIGNANNYNYLIVKKQEGFFEWLDTLLNSGIEPMFFDVQSDLDSKDNYDRKMKKLKDFKDRHELYPRSTKINGIEEKIRIDVFYGDKKVFISIILPEYRRKKLMDKLEEISIWKNAK